MPLTPAKSKTYKREVAVIQLALHWFLVMLTVYVAIIHKDRELGDLVALGIGLAPWVYGFAATAFGMDAWVKQRATQEGYVAPRQEGDVLGD